MSTTILLILQGDGLTYLGNSGGETNYIEAHLEHLLLIDQWKATLILHGLRVPAEVFIFDLFTVDTLQPFDTGRLWWELPPPRPNEDYREARFSS